MCKIMKDLDRAMKKIESNHDIKLDKIEIERIKRLLCSNLCGGHCLVKYHTPVQ